MKANKLNLQDLSYTKRGRKIVILFEGIHPLGDFVIYYDRGDEVKEYITVGGNDIYLDEIIEI